MSDEDRWASAFATVEAAKAAVEQVVDQAESGDTDLESIYALADSDPLIGRVFALKVFEAIPGVGKVKARRAMEAAGVAETASLAGLKPDQRTAMVEALAHP